MAMKPITIVAAEIAMSPLGAPVYAGPNAKRLAELRRASKPRIGSPKYNHGCTNNGCGARQGSNSGCVNNQCSGTTDQACEMNRSCRTHPK